MIGSSGGSFRKIINSFLYDKIKDTAGTLKEGKSLPKGNSIKNISKRATSLRSFMGISNIIKDQAKKKKDKKTEDLKISGTTSKKNKSKSNKRTNYSGPGDANL